MARNLASYCEGHSSSPTFEGKDLQRAACGNDFGGVSQHPQALCTLEDHDSLTGQLSDILICIHRAGGVCWQCRAVSEESVLRSQHVRSQVLLRRGKGENLCHGIHSVMPMPIDHLKLIPA